MIFSLEYTFFDSRCIFYPKKIFFSQFNEKLKISGKTCEKNAFNKKKCYFFIFGEYLKKIDVWKILNPNFTGKCNLTPLKYKRVASNKI